MPLGSERDHLFLLVHQLETATEIYDFLFDAQKRETATEHQKVA